MIDKILDLTDLATELNRVLDNAHRIRNYRQYLEVNFNIYHAASMSHYRPFPDDVDVACCGQADAYVDKGVWKWMCRMCGNAFFADRRNRFGFCLACLWPEDGWAAIRFPHNTRQIEQILVQMPGYRDDNYLRDWKPGWTTQHLTTRLRKAKSKQEAGHNLRKLSIAPSRTVAIGEIVQASYLNNNVKEPLDDLSGDNGSVEFRHGIVPASYTTTERDALPSPPIGLVLWNSTNNRLEYYDGSAYQGVVDSNTIIVITALMDELIQTGINQHLSDSIHVVPPGVIPSIWTATHAFTYGTATINWSNPTTGNPVVQVDAQYRINLTDQWTDVENVGNSPWAWTISKGSTEITSHYLRLRAKNLGGGEWTEPIRVIRLRNLQPTISSFISMTSTSVTVSFSHTRGDGSGIDYNLYEIDGTEVLSGTVGRGVHLTLTVSPGTSYYIRGRAHQREPAYVSFLTPSS